MTFKNNKTKTTTTIIASLVIGLVMLSPMTILPNVNAQDDLIPIPSHALKTLDNIHQQLHLHKGWIGMMRWNATDATIDYLGPMDTNPYRSNNPLAKMGQSGSPSDPVNTAIAPTTDTSTSTGQEYKEVSSFQNYAGTSPVILKQLLDALNSNKAHLMQGGIFYDSVGAWSPPNKWHFNVDSYTVNVAGSCNEDAGVPTVSAALNMNTGDSIQEYIYQQQGSAGQYNLGETDTTLNTGYVTSFTYSGDSGSWINLGKNTNNSCTINGSGPEVEELDNSNSGTTIHYGTMIFNEWYYDTPTSGKTTSVNGWNAAQGWGSATAWGSLNPAQATFSYP